LAEVTDPAKDPDLRAWHLALAAAGPDEDVAQELERSAERAQSRGALTAAAAFLERAAGLSADQTRRLSRTLAAAEAKLLAGEFDAASGLLARAEVGPLDELQRARVDFVRTQIAHHHSQASGDTRDVPRLLLDVARRLEPIDVGLARLVYLHTLGAAWFTGILARGTGMDEVAQAAISAPAFDPLRRSDILLDAFAVVGTRGVSAAGLLLRQAAAAYALQGPPGSQELQDVGTMPMASQLGSVLWDLDTLKGIASRFVDLARAGVVILVPPALNLLASALLYEGDLQGAASALEEASVVREVIGSTVPPWFAPYLLALRGREPEASEMVQAAIADAAAQAQGYPLALAYWASATLHNGLGRYGQALASGSEAARFVMDWTCQLALHELVEAAVRSGRPDLAIDALERLSATVTGDSDWALGIEARCRALISDSDSAEALYLEAIERLDRSPIRPEAARAHLLYGEWLRREGRRVDARHHLRTAYERLSQMGMEAFAERARNELAATGETVRKRTFETFDELTPQELQIARLAADGCSNPQIGSQLFISAHTVEWHLRKVFMKLNVSSRKELGDALPGIGLASATS
jgi:tetratricopeptide (TPR) repeat protein